MKHVLTAAAILPLAFFLAGCGSAPPPQTPAKAALPEAHLPEAHVDPATAGVISGAVYFHGDAPANPTIDMSSNPDCARQHTKPVKADIVAVNRNGTLRNAFVWIKDGLAPAHWTPPAEPVTLTQSGCIYEPHVLGIMTGQKLAILNDDPVNHNVHAASQVNRPWNIYEPPKDPPTFRVFTSPEVLFRVTCSVHPWMRSYIGVSPHPFFAVTGDDGSFTLRGVPPGTYTIEVVQEKLGRKEGKLTLAPSGAATLDFTYGS